MILLMALLLALNASFASVNIVDTPRPEEKWGYAPTTALVQPGTWVTWSNGGTDAHTVTAVDGAFDSGELGPSEGYSWYFDRPGTFDYVCTLHPWMQARVVVGDGTAEDPDDSGDDTSTEDSTR